MTDFFEIDEKNKSINIIDLDDFSAEDLEKYITELEKEIERVKVELKKKDNLKKNAEMFFK